jgi:anti-anti-sigma factor
MLTMSALYRCLSFLWHNGRNCKARHARKSKSERDMFEANVANVNEVTVVEARGRVDSATAAQFGTALMGAVDGGARRVVLDLGGVDYMSSAGLREIVAALKKIRKAQGDIRLAEPAARVREVLEMSGLDTFVQIYPSRAEALKSF